MPLYGSMLAFSICGSYAGMVLVSNEEANSRKFLMLFKPPPPLKFSLDFLWSVCIGGLGGDGA